MSLENKKEITDRIWQHSKAASVPKMMLLALVEHADDDGFCYPAHETIGKMIGLGGKPRTIQRNVLHHLNPLTQSGELISWKQQGKRGGRGFTNIYLLTVGLTDEQIRERIQRRFQLVNDEVDAALLQAGETYDRLCADRKIAADKLDLTNPEAKKGVKNDAIEPEKPPKYDGHNPDNPPINDTQSLEESKKGVKFGGGTKESSNPESNPSKESKILSPKQHVFLALAELCRIDLKVSTEKQQGQLGQASTVLCRSIADVDLFKIKFDVYWAKIDWRGKQGQAPTPAQVREVYGDYCHWLKNGEIIPVHQNGRAKEPEPYLDKTALEISAAIKSRSRPRPPKG